MGAFTTSKIYAIFSGICFQRKLLLFKFIVIRWALKAPTPMRTAIVISRIFILCASHVDMRYQFPNKLICSNVMEKQTLQIAKCKGFLKNYNYYFYNLILLNLWSLQRADYEFNILSYLAIIVTRCISRLISKRLIVWSI